MRRRRARPQHIFDRRGPQPRPSRLKVPRPALLIGIAALVGVAAGGVLSADPTALTPSYGETIQGCRAVDGDTLRCGGERVRLLAIDAPELPGHCREGRRCAPGDPHASTRSLIAAVSGTMQIQRYGKDDYGRTLAAVAGPMGDLSCHQLRSGNAVYRSDWDEKVRIARTCPLAIR